MTDIMWVTFTKGTPIHYRCRGVGETYNYFYRVWVPKSSYKCTSEDFPWDYFIFTDPADHQRLLEDFPDCVEEEEEE